MKHLFLVKAFFLIAITCSNNEDRSIPSSNQHFFCKINNVDFNPTFKSGVNEPLSNAILITGNNSNGKTVQVIMPNNIAPGNYTIINNQPSVLGLAMQYSQSDDDSDFGLANNASLTITEHNQSTKTIKGTFSFTGTILIDNSSFAITAGAFTIQYINP